MIREFCEPFPQAFQVMHANASRNIIRHSQWCTQFLCSQHVSLNTSLKFIFTVAFRIIKLLHNFSPLPVIQQYSVITTCFSTLMPSSGDSTIQYLSVCDLTHYLSYRPFMSVCLLLLFCLVCICLSQRYVHSLMKLYKLLLILFPLNN
jgi:hypothetical protein